MQPRRMRASLALFTVALSLPLAAATALRPQGTDGFTEVHLANLDEAYVEPGADFHRYTRLLVEPAGMSFRRDWMRNMTRERDLARRIDPDDAQAIVDRARANFDEVFAAGLQRAGWTLASAPGPDVLRVSPRVVDFYVNAPDTPTAARTRTYTSEAGSATLVVELRDSVGGGLLGVTVDRRRTRSAPGSTFDTDRLTWTNDVTNRADFRALFRTWARLTAGGLDRLRRDALASHDADDASR